MTPPKDYKSLAFCMFLPPEVLVSGIKISLQIRPLVKKFLTDFNFMQRFQQIVSEGVLNGRTHKKGILSKGENKTVDRHSSDESAELRVYPLSLLDGK